MFVPEQSMIMAGLLTFSIFRRPSRSVSGTVAGGAFKFTEITAAGTVQDLHLVPYYPFPGNGNRNHNQHKYRYNTWNGNGILINSSLSYADSLSDPIYEHLHGDSSYLNQPEINNFGYFKLLNLTTNE